MNMDFYINNISKDKIIGRGFQNKCYDFFDVVLLESRYFSGSEVKSYLSEVSKLKGILDSIDVHSYKIIDYKVFNDRLYILESKVKGSSLQDTSFDIDSSVFINRLKELNNYDILKQFVSDYLVLSDNGIYADPGTPNNFLFDGKHVYFLDLGVSVMPIDKKYICFYILYNVMHTYCQVKSEDVSSISFLVNSIYDKLCSIYKELGYDSSMYTMSPNGSISDYISKRIDRFNNDICVSRTK